MGTHRIEAGQVWQDCDRRVGDRRVRVVSVDGTHATVVPVGTTGRQTRIRLDRFRPTSTGYRLILNPDGSPA